MATILNRTQTFATNGTVTAAGLHNLIDDTGIYAGLITTQTELTTVGTADQLLIAVGGVSDTGAPRRATVQNLFDDALSAGTYTGLNLSGALTYGTATGNRTVSTSATITNGTITNGVIPTGTFGTTTSTAATITNGTITTGLIPTLTAGTTTGTAGIFTSGTIGNLSTTLAGDFTISQGTGTLGTSGVTLGTYGSVSAIPFLTVNAKGIITAATTGTFSTTPADGSITPVKLSQPFTSGTSVASTSGTAIDFTSIPSWVKRVTVMFNAVSTNGIAHVLVQVGSGSVSTSGYVSTSAWTNDVPVVALTAQAGGFCIYGDTAGFSRSGTMTITLLASNLWVSSHGVGGVYPGTFFASNGGGVSPTLGGALDRVRITTVNGTDTFDAGSINIMYEG